MARFTIIDDPYGYRVSIPNYHGGEVVDAADFDALAERLEETNQCWQAERELLKNVVNQRNALRTEVNTRIDRCNELAAERDALRAIVEEIVAADDALAAECGGPSVSVQIDLLARKGRAIDAARKLLEQSK